MNIREAVELKTLSTMRLGGVASYAVEAKTEQDVVKASEFAESKNLPVIMIGTGSNIIWKDEGFSGLIIINKIHGFKLEKTESGANAEIGAGENWDEVVGKVVDSGLSGIEQLSLIPGTAGATPIQNVGAYGREISDVFVCLKAYDRKEKGWVTLKKDDCGFAYRTSRFKTDDKDRFLITSITLSLSFTHSEPPFYSSLQNYLDDHGVVDYTAENIRKAVIDIRSSKLPDPARVANCGSFFKNPVVDKQKIDELSKEFPEMVYWPAGDGKAKISAAWLLQSAGFKDYHDEATGMSTWPKQPLVLVNEAARSTADLIAFKESITAKIYSQFAIKLEQEPEILP